MSRTTPAPGPGRTARGPGADAGPRAASLLGALGAAQLALAGFPLVLLVAGSVRVGVGAAGSASALYTTAAILATLGWGRLCRGARTVTVLRSTGLLSVVAAGLLAGVLHGHPTAWVLCACAAAVGAFRPPVAAAGLAQLAGTIEDPGARQRVMALRMAVLEASYLLAPVVIAVVRPWAGDASVVLLFGAAMLGSAVWTATAWRPPVQPTPTPAVADAPQRRPVLVRLMVVAALLGAATAGAEVVITARASASGHPGSIGPLLVLFSAASLAGGLLYAARGSPWSVRVRLTVSLAGCALALLPLAVVTGGTVLYAAAALAGLPVATALATHTAACADLLPGADARVFAAEAAVFAGGSAAGVAVVAAVCARADGGRGAWVLVLTLMLSVIISPHRVKVDGRNGGNARHP